MPNPPIRPTVINARYIPEDQLPPGTRNFTPPKNHKTWGNRVQPLGAWRIRPTTQKVIVLEGLFDLLITAQKIHELGLDESVEAVYTNGAQSCPPNAGLVCPARRVQLHPDP
jgi:hypothetical protein